MKTAEIQKLEGFEKIQKMYLEVANKETFTKEISFATQLVTSNKQLAKCDHNSILKAIYNTALTGLTLNPVMKMAYLVPRYTGGQMQACLEPSYQGLVKLITDTGSVTHIDCHLVYKGDVFEPTLGSEVTIKHIPKFETEEIEKVYAIATLHNGSRQIEIMTIKQIYEIRDKSESYKAFKGGKISSCVWSDFEGEMCRKTTIRRIAKYLPKTDQWQHLAEAINLDEQDYQVSSDKVDYIESLIRTCSLDDNKKWELENELYNNITPSGANKMIEYLKNNQKDPIESGENYSQKAIQNKLSEKLADETA
jgi:recombination protein RecT